MCPVIAHSKVLPTFTVARSRHDRRFSAAWPLTHLNTNERDDRRPSPHRPRDRRLPHGLHRTPQELEGAAACSGARWAYPFGPTYLVASSRLSGGPSTT